MAHSRPYILLLIATAVWVVGSDANASAVSTSPGLQSVHWALESGGMSCYDPQSWVWRAPRAEQVAVEVLVERPCEIGRPGCERRPESVVEVTLDEQASQLCSLKLAHHGKVDGEEPFDNESCLQSARETLSIDPDPPQPHDVETELVCREADPECRSMPPVRDSDPQISSSPVGAVLAAATVGGSNGPGAWTTLEHRPRRGVQRRVDRPPAAIPREIGSHQKE